MGEDSKIAWTDNTFNPWIGCTKVGPGCDNCYAEEQDRHRGWTAHGWGAGEPRYRTKQGTWAMPVKWNKEAKEAGVRRKVFCASLADVFDNEVPQAWRDDLFDLIRATPHLDWILVTKRIGNVKKMLPDDWRELGIPYSNVWLLITVVNQEEADRDIPKLLNTPAWVRGVSIEPQLGPISLRWAKWVKWNHESGAVNNQHDGLRMLDWVICGAESGKKQRGFSLNWARELRDQCVEAGVAFFLKQIPGGGRKRVIETPELDGRQWMEFPNLKKKGLQK